MAETGICREMIEDGLHRLDMNAGDLVFFHSSLKDLAPARELVKFPNAGADMVIDAWLNVVGPAGTAAVPTLSANFAVPDGLAFDVKLTRSLVGSITNVFRQRPGACRSHHPTHSVAAIGRLAAPYTAGHELVATFDWDSPYGRTVRWDGYICYFCTSTKSNTHLHAVEQWMGLPYLEQQFALVRGLNGETLKVKTYGSPPGPRDFYRRDTSLAHELLAKAGVWKETHIRRGLVRLMKARDCFDVIFRGIIAKPDLLLAQTDDPWTAKYRQATIDHVRNRWGQAAG